MKINKYASTVSPHARTNYIKILKCTCCTYKLLNIEISLLHSNLYICCRTNNPCNSKLSQLKISSTTLNQAIYVNRLISNPMVKRDSLSSINSNFRIQLETNFFFSQFLLPWNYLKHKHRTFSHWTPTTDLTIAYPRPLHSTHYPAINSSIA